MLLCEWSRPAKWPVYDSRSLWTLIPSSSSPWLILAFAFAILVRGGCFPDRAETMMKKIRKAPEYELHPIADIFPLMSEAELQELAADIEANGVKLPILLYQEKILDGRNRYLACRKKGIRPPYHKYTGHNPIKWCLSLNLHRRHLTPSQTAAVGANIANLGHGGDRRSDQAAKGQLETHTQAEAAELADSSERSVARAVAVKKADPELHEKVLAGETTLAEATRAITERNDSGSQPEAATAILPFSNGRSTELTDEDRIINDFKRYVRQLSQDFHKSTVEIRSYISDYLSTHR